MHCDDQLQSNGHKQEQELRPQEDDLISMTFDIVNDCNENNENTLHNIQSRELVCYGDYNSSSTNNNDVNNRLDDDADSNISLNVDRLPNPDGHNSADRVLEQNPCSPVTQIYIVDDIETYALPLEPNQFVSNHQHHHHHPHYLQKSDLIEVSLLTIQPMQFSDANHQHSHNSHQQLQHEIQLHNHHQQSQQQHQQTLQIQQQEHEHQHALFQLNQQYTNEDESPIMERNEQGQDKKKSVDLECAIDSNHTNQNKNHNKNRNQNQNQNQNQKGTNSPVPTNRELHNEIERRRRSRIKHCCEVLRTLVPGLSEKTDKATVLEHTVKFVSHLANCPGLKCKCEI